MKKINLSITGCMGRMGQQLIKNSKKDKRFKLNSLTEGSFVSKKINGIKLQLNTPDAFKNTDVIIDFTVPQCTLEVLKIASKLKISLRTLYEIAPSKDLLITMTVDNILKKLGKKALERVSSISSTAAESRPRCWERWCPPRSTTRCTPTRWGARRCWWSLSC